MTDTAIRRTLSSAVGTMEYYGSLLARVEHGDDRVIVARTRAALRATANDLLMLKARLFPGDQP